MAFIFELSEQLPDSGRLLHSFGHFCATPYALLTVNLPLVVHAQIIESSDKRGWTGMLKTNSASWGRSMLFTLATSQLLFSASRRSDTITASPWGPRGLTTLKDSDFGIHPSSQIWTLRPLPIHHREPFTIISLAHCITFSEVWTHSLCTLVSLVQWLWWEFLYPH